MSAVASSIRFCCRGLSAVSRRKSASVVRTDELPDWYGSK